MSSINSKEGFTVGLLTTIDNELLPYMISCLKSNNCNNIVVICDEKLKKDKDKIIWNERTGGYFEKKINLSIYNIESPIIPFYFVDNHNSESVISIIKETGTDCLLNAGTPRKLNKRIIDVCDHGIVNIHPGILPKYKGCSAVEWSLYNDDKVGNTAHFMTEEYDVGPIIKFEWYEFTKCTDYQSIRVEVYKRGCMLAGRVLSLIMNSKLVPSDIPIQEKTTSKYWSPITEDKMKIVSDRIKKSKYRYQSL
jgi:folate-dependent phosphoribosylglycinamide formyltransferase PurN